MRSLNTREKVLLGLMAVVAIVVVVRLRGDGLGFGGEDAGPKPLDPLSGEPPVVRMDLLAMATAGYDPNGRNLFQYYTPPPPPRPVKKPKPPPPPPPPPPAPKKKPESKPAKVAPRPPDPNFDYLGYLGPKDDRIAVFSNDERMMVAKVGEVVEADFRLLEFKYQTVVFGFTDERFAGQTTELKMPETE